MTRQIKNNTKNRCTASLSKALAFEKAVHLLFAFYSALYALPMWAGDRIFLRLIASPHPFFSLKLRYENGVLIEAALDGRPLEL